MDQTILDMLIKQGGYAALFIWLFFKTMKDSKDREERLMNHVERTTDTLKQIEQSVSGMQEEIKDIREQIEK
ncbi:BhlA/UviB family holin-like peptide [Priestia sp. SIMBA_032]|uniref:BhlA/UviB family holin-like peptide n=1 Tax=Priestia sp. SIMBA_032 TaxID=3085775 RepID=UPI00397902ED